MGRRLFDLLGCAAGVLLLVWSANNFAADAPSFRQITRGCFQAVIGLVFLVAGVLDLIRGPRSTHEPDVPDEPGAAPDRRPPKRS